MSNDVPLKNVYLRNITIPDASTGNIIILCRTIMKDTYIY